jgi:hypothetical protein
VVRWPTGKEQVFTGLPVNSRIQLTEGEDEAAIEPLGEPGDVAGH